MLHGQYLHIECIFVARQQQKRRVLVYWIFYKGFYYNLRMTLKDCCISVVLSCWVMDGCLVSVHTSYLSHLHLFINLISHSISNTPFCIPSYVLLYLYLSISFHSSPLHVLQSDCAGVAVNSRVSSKIQQLLNTLKRPKRPPLREFFVDDFEELLDGELAWISKSWGKCLFPWYNL